MFSNTVSPNLSVGSLVGGKQIVLATESTTLSPVWKPASGTNLPILVTNLLLTTRSTLVAFTQTNFPPSDFEIPSDYQEVSELIPRAINHDPGVFGHGPVGSNFTESIRQRYGKGRPLIQLPKGSPSDKFYETPDGK